MEERFRGGIHHQALLKNATASSKNDGVDSHSDEPEDFIYAPSKHACGTSKYGQDDQAVTVTSGN